MKLYHGGINRVEKPILLQVSRKLDFGAGFYTTSDFEQAKRWATIKQQRNNSERAVVSVYNLNPSKALNIKEFKYADEKWLDFIMKHRMGLNISNKFDIIIGPVANDTLYETLSLYERGILTHEETIVRLKVHELTDQITFKTEKALSFLNYESEELI